MIYCFDLDGTLCTSTGGKYNEAKPYNDRIEAVNKLHDAGHVIIIETARGSATGIDWRPLTIEQLDKWGIKYNNVRVGHKIEADIYVDDKAIKAEQFFR